MYVLVIYGTSDDNEEGGPEGSNPNEDALCLADAVSASGCYRRL